MRTVFPYEVENELKAEFFGCAGAATLPVSVMP